MFAAIGLITIGGIMVYSALKGITITDVLAGVTGDPIDARGGTPVDPNSAGGALTTPPSSTPDTPGTQGSPGGLPGVQVGTTIIDGKPVANWIAQEVLWARHTGGWTGQITSGVRTVEEQRQACIHVCGNPNGCPGRCAHPGDSNHQGIAYPEGAIDVGSAAQAVSLVRVLRGYPGGSRLKCCALPADLVHLSATGH